MANLNLESDNSEIERQSSSCVAELDYANDVSSKSQYEAYEHVAMQSTSISQVANMTLEVKYFIENISKYSLRCNKVDSDLSEILYEVIDLISKFLDGNPCRVSLKKRAISYINFERNTLKKQYFCEICQKIVTKSSDPLKRHLYSETHRFGMRVLRDGNYEAIAFLKRKRRMEDIIEENPEIVARVLQQIKRQEKKKFEQIQNLPKNMKRILLGDFSYFLEEAVRKAEEIKNSSVFDQIGGQLKAALLKRFPQMNILFFGSRKCGLANDDSNLNVAIEIDLLPPSKRNTGNVLEVINLIKSLLKKKSKAWGYRKFKEEVGISLIARNIKTNIDCDIKVTDFITYWEYLLISHFISQQPIIQDVCLFIKYWIKETELNKHCSSYFTTWLVIFFFQIERLLPPITFLQALIPPILIGPWNVSSSTMSLKELGINIVSRDYDTTCFLIQKFFQFYSTFEFEKFILCPYLGYAILRDAYKIFNVLQPQYWAFIINKPIQLHLSMSTSVCFQNPFQQNQNIGQNISKGGLRLFRQYCLQSMNILMNKE